MTLFFNPQQKRWIVEARTIPEMLEKRAADTPDRPAHYTRGDQKNWVSTSWKEYYETVAAIAGGLKKVGIKPGDHIGIMAPTSQTWEFVQMAILYSRGVVIGIDLNEIQENINLIVKKSALAGIVVQNLQLLKKIDPENLSGLTFYISMDTLDEPRDSGRVLFLDDLKKSEQQTILPAETDPATIIFTSGTTGEPKGILYRHDQVRIACRSILDGFDDLDSHYHVPCWLPLSNLFQRIINFCAIELGATTYFVDNPRQIISLLPQINPHLFIGVPRVFEKVYEAIQARISEKSPLQQKLIEYAVSMGDRHAAAIRNNTSLSFFEQVQYKLMDRLILKNIRSFLGKNMKYLISGSAPMPVWLLEKYHALGILVLEAYGSSENIIPNAMNVPKAFKFGTVGRPRPENEIKFLEDGELLIKGPGVFEGYYKDTSDKAVFSDDGYYPTGDYVSADKDGFLSITGRKSEVFKTSTGKKIAPAGIEEYLRQVPYVEHAVVFGAGKKFVIALVSLSPDGLARLAGQEGEKDLSKIEANVDEQCLAAIATDITACLEPLPGFQQPAGLLVTGYQLNVENKDLTANFKLKRKHISERFDAPIQELYRQLETGEGTERYLFNEVGRLLVYYLAMEIEKET